MRSDFGILKQSLEPVWIGVELGPYYRKHLIYTWVRGCLRMATFHVGNESMSERDVYNIIKVQISRFIRQDFPILISSIRKELIFVMDKQFRILQADQEAEGIRTGEVSFIQLDAFIVPRFFGERNLSSACVGLQTWIMPFLRASARRRPRLVLRHVFCETKLEIGGAWLFRALYLMWSSIWHGKIFSPGSRENLCRRLRLSNWLRSI